MNAHSSIIEPMRRQTAVTRDDADVRPRDSSRTHRARREAIARRKARNTKRATVSVDFLALLNL
jgi:hypothetical protein